MRHTLGMTPVAARSPLAAGLSVVMTAHNEADVIVDCLKSVQSVATEIVVVDGASDDGTADVAEQLGARVIRTTNKLMLNVNKNMAIDAATSEWVLLLDPDERVSDELAVELLEVVQSAGETCDGYWIPRRNHELGRWIKRMGFYPGYQLRLFRNGKARFPCEHIHEMVTVDGTVGKLTTDLLHFPPQTLFAYLHKRNLYSEHRAAFLYEQKAPFRLSRMLTEPLWHFVKAYFLRGGWREGIPGLVMGVTNGYGNFLQHAKLWERWRVGPGAKHTDDLDEVLRSNDHR
jgi:glycosyltransferase involved in cell wall biosynthesis